MRLDELLALDGMSLERHVIQSSESLTRGVVERACGEKIDA
jgi:hypothetical protein